MPARFLLGKDGPCGESVNNCGEPVGQFGKLLDLTSSKVSIHIRQHADRILARDSGVAIGGEPVAKAIGDRSQQWQREKPAMSPEKKRM